MMVALFVTLGVGFYGWLALSFALAWRRGERIYD